MKNNKYQNFAWMPLTGFDKNLPDKGVSILLDRAQNKLDGVCLFAFHPDIINQHSGMAKEKILPPPRKKRRQVLVKFTK
jgi:hypothetical protein